MKKFWTVLLILLFAGISFAGENDLSKPAVAFYSDNNYNKTLDLLLQIPESERTAQDWLLLGNLYDEKNETTNAIFMYQKAITKDKKFYKSYYNLANIYLDNDNYGLAIENYKKAIKVNNKNPYIYYNLASAYIKSGDLNKAKSSLIQAVTLKNDVAEFHYNLAYVYNKLNKQKLAETYLSNYNKLTENK